jgi:hypothetical protein
MKISGKRFFSFILLTLILSTSLSGSTRTPIGKVIEVIGNVLLNSKVPLGLGDKIYPEDQVSTGVDGLLKIELTHNGLLTIASETEMNFNRYRKNQKKEKDKKNLAPTIQDEKSFFQLIKGQIRGEAPPSRPQIIIHTSLSQVTFSAGKEGLSFVMSSEIDSFQDSIAQVALTQGQAAIVNPINKTKTSLKTGELYVGMANQKKSTFLSQVHPFKKMDTSSEEIEMMGSEKLSDLEIAKKSFITPFIKLESVEQLKNKKR